MVAAIIVVLVIIGLAGLVLLGLALLLPAASQAAERVRIEREAAEASWRIHQQASAAFEQMLGAARDGQRQERP